MKDALSVRFLPPTLHSALTRARLSLETAASGISVSPRDLNCTERRGGAPSRLSTSRYELNVLMISNKSVKILVMDRKQPPKSALMTGHIAPSNGAAKTKTGAEKLAKIALIDTNSVTLAC